LSCQQSKNERKHGKEYDSAKRQNRYDDGDVIHVCVPLLLLVFENTHHSVCNAKAFVLLLLQRAAHDQATQSLGKSRPDSLSRFRDVMAIFDLFSFKKLSSVGAFFWRFCSTFGSILGQGAFGANIVLYWFMFFPKD